MHLRYAAIRLFGSHYARSRQGPMLLGQVR